MIFAHTFEHVANGTKTVTRRLWKPEYKWRPVDVAIGEKSESGASTRELWRVGKTYAAQPGRGKSADFRIEVLSLRRERLKEITAAECIAEGVRVRADLKTGKLLVALAPSPCASDYLPEGSFAEMNNGLGLSASDMLVAEYFALWDTINRKPGTRVKDNPEVVRIEFRKVSPYRLLKKGEIVLATDEYYDDAKKEWVVPQGSIGSPAPDPRYTSHRLFRRKI